MPVNRPMDETSAQFLYQIITHVDRQIIPIGQLLTEKQDAAFLTYWINCWRASGAKIPKVVTCDRSSALENAISMDFNFMSFRMYNEQCLRILCEDKQYLTQIVCRIRNDIAHLIKSIVQWNWKNFNTAEKSNAGKLKFFFTKCIGYLSTIKDFATLCKVAKSIFRIANAKIDTPEIQTLRRKFIEDFKKFPDEDVKVLNDTLNSSFVPSEEDVLTENRAVSVPGKKTEKEDYMSKM